MFRFLLGLALGAGGFWAWQSFGRDLFGMGGDQSSSYSYGSGTTGSSYGSTPSYGSRSTPTYSPPSSSAG